MIKWDEWGGTDEDNVVFLAKHLIKFPWLRISLHKMIGADKRECFHTHPAHAIRIILWGGYVEEAMNDDGIRWFARWWPFSFSWITPSFTHRIDEIKAKKSYSLWIRFKKIKSVELIGTGWKDD